MNILKERIKERINLLPKITIKQKGNLFNSILEEDSLKDITKTSDISTELSMKKKNMKR
jgi:hypothetical protein